MSKGCAAPHHTAPHGQRGTGAGSGLGLQQSCEGRPAVPACPWCPPWAFPAGSVISAMPRMCALLGGLLSPLGPPGAPWQLHGCRISQQGWGSCCCPCPRSAALVSLCPGYSETRFPGSRSRLPDVPPQAAAQTWKQQIPLFSPGLSQAVLLALLLVLACLLHCRAGARGTQPWPRRVLQAGADPSVPTLGPRRARLGWAEPPCQRVGTSRMAARCPPWHRQRVQGAAPMRAGSPTPGRGMGAPPAGLRAPTPPRPSFRRKDGGTQSVFTSVMF